MKTRLAESKNKFKMKNEIIGVLWLKQDGTKELVSCVTNLKEVPNYLSNQLQIAAGTGLLTRERVPFKSPVLLTNGKHAHSMMTWSYRKGVVSQKNQHDEAVLKAGLYGDVVAMALDQMDRPLPAEEDMWNICAALNRAPSESSGSTSSENNNKYSKKTNTKSKKPRPDSNKKGKKKKPKDEEKMVDDETAEVDLEHSDNEPDQDDPEEDTGEDLKDFIDNTPIDNPYPTGLPDDEEADVVLESHLVARQIEALAEEQDDEEVTLPVLAAEEDDEETEAAE